MVQVTPFHCHRLHGDLTAEDEMLMTQRSQPLFILAVIGISSLLLLSLPHITSLWSRADELQITIDKLYALAAKKSKASSLSHLNAPAANEPNRDLILYSYHETAESMINFAFFRQHALHAKADFILMLNGEHSVELSKVAALPNVRIVERENRCFDLGGFHEILTANHTLTTAYKRFMFINSSLRGPFFPPWADKICWSDAYWEKLDARTKLVGMSWNCANGILYPPHLQSMVLAFTQETLLNILLPSMKCYEDMGSAVTDGETQMANRIMQAGGNVFAMESRFVAHAGVDGKDTAAFLEWCVDRPEKAGTGGDDVLHTGNYEGSTLHPYETM